MKKKVMILTEIYLFGKDHTYTAIFDQTRIVITVIWQNWNGTELQRKTVIAVVHLQDLMILIIHILSHHGSY